jgi:hypothetical protein
MSKLRIPAYRMDDRFTPEEAQERIALFGQATQSLSSSAGIFTWDHPYITRHGLAVCESTRIAQKHLGC